MDKIALDSVPKFYQTYVKLVKDLTIPESLDHSMKRFEVIVSAIPEDKGSFRYAEGKWTIRELLVHVVDAERIFAYRALRFARNDQTMLPGFEENDYVPNSGANTRSLKSIQESMRVLRLSTIDLFNSFDTEMLNRTGAANNTRISVTALGYVIAGHQLHHLAVLEERYLK